VTQSQSALLLQEAMTPPDSDGWQDTQHWLCPESQVTVWSVGNHSKQTRTARSQVQSDLDASPTPALSQAFRGLVV
jgi:hypothetical protein